MPPQLKSSLCCACDQGYYLQTIKMAASMTSLFQKGYMFVPRHLGRGTKIDYQILKLIVYKTAFGVYKKWSTSSNRLNGVFHLFKTHAKQLLKDSDRKFTSGTKRKPCPQRALRYTKTTATASTHNMYHSSQAPIACPFIVVVEVKPTQTCKSGAPLTHYKISAIHVQHEKPGLW